MIRDTLIFYISAIVILILALLIDIVHSWARTGIVASVTEALGKLVLGSALSLCAIGLLNKKDPNYNPGYLVLLVLVSVFLLLVIFIQVIIYRTQRDLTREYLKDLVNSNQSKTTLAPNDLRVVADILAEVVDADFVPNSLGNKLGGGQRRKIRIMAARWLNSMGISVKPEELIVPVDQRVYYILYQVLGVLVVLASFFYILVFFLTSNPPLTNAPPS